MQHKDKKEKLNAFLRFKRQKNLEGEGHAVNTLFSF